MDQSQPEFQSFVNEDVNRNLSEIEALANSAAAAQTSSSRNAVNVPTLPASMYPQQHPHATVQVPNGAFSPVGVNPVRQNYQSQVEPPRGVVWLPGSNGSTAQTAVGNVQVPPSASSPGRTQASFVASSSLNVNGLSVRPACPPAYPYQATAEGSAPVSQMSPVQSSNPSLAVLLDQRGTAYHRTSDGNFVRVHVQPARTGLQHGRQSTEVPRYVHMATNYVPQANAVNSSVNQQQVGIPYRSPLGGSQFAQQQRGPVSGLQATYVVQSNGQQMPMMSSNQGNVRQPMPAVVVNNVQAVGYPSASPVVSTSASENFPSQAYSTTSANSVQPNQTSGGNASTLLSVQLQQRSPQFGMERMRSILGSMLTNEAQPRTPEPTLQLPSPNVSIYRVPQQASEQQEDRQESQQRPAIRLRNLQDLLAIPSAGGFVYNNSSASSPPIVAPPQPTTTPPPPPPPRLIAPPPLPRPSMAPSRGPPPLRPANGLPIGLPRGMRPIPREPGAQQFARRAGVFQNRPRPPNPQQVAAMPPAAKPEGQASSCRFGNPGVIRPPVPTASTPVQPAGPSATPSSPVVPTPASSVPRPSSTGSAKQEAPIPRPRPLVRLPKCMICGLAFYKVTLLRNHIANQHPGKTDAEVEALMAQATGPRGDPKLPSTSGSPEKNQPSPNVLPRSQPEPTPPPPVPPTPPPVAERVCKNDAEPQQLAETRTVGKVPISSKLILPFGGRVGSSIEIRRRPAPESSAQSTSSSSAGSLNALQSWKEKLLSSKSSIVLTKRSAPPAESVRKVGNVSITKATGRPPATKEEAEASRSPRSLSSSERTGSPVVKPPVIQAAVAPAAPQATIQEGSPVVENASSEADVHPEEECDAVPASIPERENEEEFFDVKESAFDAIEEAGEAPEEASKALDETGEYEEAECEEEMKHFRGEFNEEELLEEVEYDAHEYEQHNEGYEEEAEQGAEVEVDFKQCSDAVGEDMELEEEEPHATDAAVEEEERESPEIESQLDDATLRAESPESLVIESQQEDGTLRAEPEDSLCSPESSDVITSRSSPKQRDGDDNSSHQAEAGTGEDVVSSSVPSNEGRRESIRSCDATPSPCPVTLKPAPPSPFELHIEPGSSRKTPPPSASASPMTNIPPLPPLEVDIRPGPSRASVMPKSPIVAVTDRSPAQPIAGASCDSWVPQANVLKANWKHALKKIPFRAPGRGNKPKKKKSSACGSARPNESVPNEYRVRKRKRPQKKSTAGGPPPKRKRATKPTAAAELASEPGTEESAEVPADEAGLREIVDTQSVRLPDGRYELTNDEGEKYIYDFDPCLLESAQVEALEEELFAEVGEKDEDFELSDASLSDDEEADDQRSLHEEDGTSSDGSSLRIHRLAAKQRRRRPRRGRIPSHSDASWEVAGSAEEDSDDTSNSGSDGGLRLKLRRPRTKLKLRRASGSPRQSGSSRRRWLRIRSSSESSDENETDADRNESAGVFNRFYLNDRWDFDYQAFVKTRPFECLTCHTFFRTFEEYDRHRKDLCEEYLNKLYNPCIEFEPLDLNTLPNAGASSLGSDSDEEIYLSARKRRRVLDSEDEEEDIDSVAGQGSSTSQESPNEGPSVENSSEAPSETDGDVVEENAEREDAGVVEEMNAEESCGLNRPDSREIEDDEPIAAEEIGIEAATGADDQDDLESMAMAAEEIGLGEDHGEEDQQVVVNGSVEIHRAASEVGEHQHEQEQQEEMETEEPDEEEQDDIEPEAHPSENEESIVEPEGEYEVEMAPSPDVDGASEGTESISGETAVQLLGHEIQMDDTRTFNRSESASPLKDSDTSTYHWEEIDALASETTSPHAPSETFFSPAASPSLDWEVVDEVDKDPLIEVNQPEETTENAAEGRPPSDVSIDVSVRGSSPNKSRRQGPEATESKVEDEEEADVTMDVADAVETSPNVDDTHEQVEADVSLNISNTPKRRKRRIKRVFSKKKKTPASTPSKKRVVEEGEPSSSAAVAAKMSPVQTRRVTRESEEVEKGPSRRTRSLAKEVEARAEEKDDGGKRVTRRSAKLQSEERTEKVKSGFSGRRAKNGKVLMKEEMPRDEEPLQELAKGELESDEDDAFASSPSNDEDYVPGAEREKRDDPLSSPSDAPSSPFDDPSSQGDDDLEQSVLVEQKSTSDAGELACCDCDVSFPTYIFAVNHVVSTHMNGQFPCPLCPFVSKSEMDTRFHLRFHGGHANMPRKDLLRAVRQVQPLVPDLIPSNDKELQKFNTKRLKKKALEVAVKLVSIPNKLYGELVMKAEAVGLTKADLNTYWGVRIPG